MMNTLRREGYGQDVSAPAKRRLPARRLTINGEDVEIRVSRSRHARVARIILGPRRPLEAVVPPGMTMRELDRFLASKRGWIGEKLAAVETIVSRPHLLGLDRPNTVWLDGEAVPIEWRPGPHPVARRAAEEVI